MLVIADAVSHKVSIQFGRREVQALRKPTKILTALRHVLIPLGHADRQPHKAFVKPETR